MLDLRPTCEHCNVDLPPASTEAMICSFECTFCKKCVEELLENVCPNCGGGFSPRPIRPSKNRKKDNYLGKHPATKKITHKPVNLQDHQKFWKELSLIPPEKR